MMRDVVVVGGGPAGLAAATTCAQRGLSVCLVDERPELGGRLLAQVHRVGGGRRVHEWIGRRFRDELVTRLTQSNVEVLSKTEAWGIFPGPTVLTSGLFPARLEARAVIVATGASEAPVPLPGWTLPGVITAGAAQTLLNAHWTRPGMRSLIIGVNPLGMAVCTNMSMAGVTVAGVVNPAPGPLSGEAAAPRGSVVRLARLAHLAPSKVLAVAGSLGAFGMERFPPLAPIIAAGYPAGGVRIDDARVHVRKCAVEILGKAQVSGVVLMKQRPSGALIDGTEETLEVDSVCLAGSVRPLIEIAAAAGCQVVHIPELGGPVPLHGGDFQTTVPGVFVAGSVSGVECGQVAAEHGNLVGEHVARFLKAVCDAGGVELILAAQARLKQARKESLIEFIPHGDRGRRALAKYWCRSFGAEHRAAGW